MKSMADLAGVEWQHIWGVALFLEKSVRKDEKRSCMGVMSARRVVGYIWCIVSLG